MARTLEEVALFLKEVKVTFRYDPGADAATIYFAQEKAGMFADDFPIEVEGHTFNFSFDSNGRVAGIEVLAVSKVFPAELLKKLGVNVPPKETGRPIPP